MYGTSSSSGNGIFLCCNAWSRWVKSYCAKDYRKTVRLAKGLEAHGFNVEQKHFFDTITIDVGPMQNVILKSAISEGINLRKIGKSELEYHWMRELGQLLLRQYGDHLV